MERDSRKQMAPKGIAIAPPHGRRQRVGRRDGEQLSQLCEPERT